MKKGWLLLLLAGLMLFAVACTGPKFVVRTTGTSSQMKMLYWQKKSFLFFSWYSQGVVKCDIDDDGSLTNCREMELVFEDQ